MCNKIQFSDKTLHREDIHRKRMKQQIPSNKTIMEWLSNDCARATDGCKVKVDGICEHNHASWLLILGIV
jgi:hypothetical protein